MDFEDRRDNVFTCSAMSGIIGDISDITELIVIQGCTTIFQQEIYRQPFLNLDSFYLQMLYYKQHFNFIVSTKSIR